MSVDPKVHLEGEPLDPRTIEARYPNAKRVLKGGLFISHSGKDFEQINRAIVEPIVYDRFMDGFFLHNRGSGGSKEYRELVRTALYYLDKFLVVVSEHSIENNWVRAEVAVAVRLRRPIIACLFDRADPSHLHPELCKPSWYRRLRPKIVLVDFNTSIESAQSELARCLDRLLRRSPYVRKHFEW
jgi:hypothetical protein